MQLATKQGLVCAPPSLSRCTIKCIHSAAEGYEDRKLQDMWSTKTPEQVACKTEDVRRRICKVEDVR